MIKSSLLLICFCWGLIVVSSAQSPQEYAKDVLSIDAIITSLYEVISGDAGQQRDWDRFHHLFTEEARLIPAGKDEEGEVDYRIISPTEYVERSGSYLEEQGFYEVEIHRITEELGPIAHVFSTYEIRMPDRNAEPSRRGINSIDLFHDGKRWWVMKVYWANETETNPIPERYLPK